MNIYKRFGKSLSSAPITSVRSLPMFTRSSEIIFVYSTKQVGSGFVFTEVDAVFVRDRATDRVRRAEPYELLPPDLQDSTRDTELPFSVTGQTAVQTQLKYYELYEHLFDTAFVSPLTAEQAAEARQLSQLFDILVPPSGLRQIYAELGKEFFDYLADV